MTSCKACGADVVVDFRAKRRFCGTCSRNPSYCTCEPMTFKPAWLRHLSAKDFTGRAA